MNIKIEKKNRYEMPKRSCAPIDIILEKMHTETIKIKNKFPGVILYFIMFFLISKI
jgi:hypothetical protein